MIPSSVENMGEKGSEEVPYYNERSTYTIDENGFGFTTQDRKIDFYARSIGLSGVISLLLSTSKLLVILLRSDKVEDIMLQVSNFSTFAKFDGVGSEKVPIREGSLKIPIEMF